MIVALAGCCLTMLLQLCGHYSRENFRCKPFVGSRAFATWCMLDCMETTHLKITGMSCEACASHVKKTLESVPRVRSATVDLKAGAAAVEHDGADSAALASAVAAEGYAAEPA
jgi:copper chaperone CopZ